MSKLDDWKTKLIDLSSRLGSKAKGAIDSTRNLRRPKGIGGPPDHAPNEEAPVKIQTPLSLKEKLLGALPDSFDLGATLEWAGAAVQKGSVSFYTTFGSIVICSYFLADLAALSIEKQIPEPPANRSSRFGGSNSKRVPSIEEYNIISVRNLFNSDGKIPGETPSDGPADDGAQPQRTSLPFNLIGTLILRDELRSIATIEDKTASQVFPVRVQDEIPSKARIIKVEARKVTFFNLTNNRKEFIDLPEDLNANAARITLGRPSANLSPTVEKDAESHFNVAKKEIDKAFSNLNEILTQARAVPHFENGVAAGYKLFQVDPAGFFGKLGFKDYDILCGINGAAINDPAKAVEALGQLKEANHIEVCLKRDGKQQSVSYDIR